MTRLAATTPRKPAPGECCEDDRWGDGSPAAFPSAGPADRLAASRRLDWRFLLPDPELSQVAFIGEDGSLREALRVFARSLTVFTPEALCGGAAAGPARSFDLVVMTDPARSMVAAADHLLKPGGWLYAEVTRPTAARLLPLRRDRAASGLLKALDRHDGFERVCMHWHWPDFENTTFICPLANLAAAAHRAASNGAGLRARWLAALARRERGRNLFASLAAHVSIIARRRNARRPDESGGNPHPGPQVPPECLSGRFLRENRQRLALDRLGIPERLTSSLVTPRFRTSSHVIVLLSEPGRGVPLLVAKRPRLPRADVSLAHEAACLRTLHALHPTGCDTVPRLVAFENMGGQPVLIETALRGRHLNASTVRRDPDRACRAVADWLAEIDQPAALPPETAAERHHRLIDDPLLRLEEHLGTGATERRLLERARLVCDRLRQFAVPAVFEHGDLCDPNLLVRDDGRISVIDWELADPAGLSAADLVFFLTFVACARARARTDAARIRAFSRAFFPRDSWTRPYLRTYLDRHVIPMEAFPSLFVLGWTRYLARRLRRLTGSAVGNSSTRRTDGLEAHPAETDRLRENRYFAFWRYAVEHADELPGHDTYLAGH